MKSVENLKLNHIDVQVCLIDTMTRGFKILYLKSNYQMDFFFQIFIFECNKRKIEFNFSNHIILYLVPNYSQ
jgi:hypothetical protein